MSESPFDAERLAGSVARILAAQGNAAEVAILANSSPRLDDSSFDNWNGGTYGYTLVLAVPIHLYAQIAEKCEAFEKTILARGREFFKATPQPLSRGCEHNPGRSRSVQRLARESKGLGWRKGLDQSRSRALGQHCVTGCDGLLFRSEAEINLYRALKSSGVTFAPLPVFIRGGSDYRRIEPDFIIIKDGVVLHVEVDGDTVHQETPVEAPARNTMLLHEGVSIERVNASECSTPASAEGCAKRLLAVLAKHKASR